jgi:hypothetical protein
MTKMNDQLHDVLGQIAVPDDDLKAARERRDAVREAGKGFPGVLRTYRAGSVATGVVTDPLEDADGGLVLDRRCYPSLGPDSDDDDPPTEVVEAFHAHVGPILRETWDGATVHDMKRGVTVRFHDPLPSGADPYVDMILTLDRKDAPGLWIPNLEAGTWDASHPEKHVELMMSGSKTLRVLRARVVRLAKCWNKGYSQPGLSSFNILALGLEAIDETSDLATAVTTFFEHASASLAICRTEDPAGVSGAIKLEANKEIVLQRLRSARDHLRAALADPDNLEVVAAELHAVFPKYLPEPIDLRSPAAAAIADALRTSNPRLRQSAAGVTVAAGAVKTARSYGGVHRG